MTKNRRFLIGCSCFIIIVGIAYLTGSILSHHTEDPLCACMLCINNRIPEDGEYLYNHYLFVLSCIWIAFMVILGYAVKERTERKAKRIHKKRNR